MIRVAHLPLLAAGVLGLAACQATPPRIEYPDTARGQAMARTIAQEELALLGLTPTLTMVDVQESALPGDEDRVFGFTVWSRVTPCQIGWTVVNLDRSGRVQEIYTRDGCVIEGLPDY